MTSIMDYDAETRTKRCGLKLTVIGICGQGNCPILLSSDVLPGYSLQNEQNKVSTGRVNFFFRFNSFISLKKHC